MPRLEVHGEGALALSSSLVDVASGVVEDAEHGDDAVGASVGAADIRLGGADGVNAEADATSALGDEGALLQSLVDTLDRVGIHSKQEARRHLGVGGAGIEESWSGVREPALAEVVVGLDGSVDVVLVDADGDTHEHMLRALDNNVVDLEEVRALRESVRGKEK